jgi:hypothetical protein
LSFLEIRAELLKSGTEKLYE